MSYSRFLFVIFPTQIILCIIKHLSFHMNLKILFTSWVQKILFENFD